VSATACSSPSPPPRATALTGCAGGDRSAPVTPRAGPAIAALLEAGTHSHYWGSLATAAQEPSAAAAAAAHRPVQPLLTVNSSFFLSDDSESFGDVWGLGDVPIPPYLPRRTPRGGVCVCVCVRVWTTLPGLSLEAYDATRVGLGR
jgi:hypothetical protein